MVAYSMHVSMLGWVFEGKAGNRGVWLTTSGIFHRIVHSLKYLTCKYFSE